MATAARPSPSSSRGPARILVVENEHVLNASLVHALTREGYEAVGARSLAEARQQQGFDLALLDLDLGDGSGLALLEEWRARGLDVPVIILSGDRSARSIERACSRLDAWDYLGKPFEIELLRARIRDGLEKAAVRRALRERFAA